MTFLRRLALSGLFFLVLASRAQATPLLQLDIIGGHYDPLTQTIIAPGQSFTLVALLTPKANQAPLATLLADTYFISAAVTPQAGPSPSSIGTFTWDNTSYNVTGDMTYGTPPLEGVDAHADEGDLAPHGIFPTYFREFAFQFNANDRAITYDTAATPGGFTPTSNTAGVSYFQTFNITTSLSGGSLLHFDLFDTYIKGCSRRGTCAMDVDIEHFAPYSHDAQSVAVPEPATLALLGIGLVAVASWRSRRKTTASING